MAEIMKLRPIKLNKTIFINSFINANIRLKYRLVFRDRCMGNLIELLDSPAVRFHFTNTVDSDIQMVNKEFDEFVMEIEIKYMKKILAAQAEVMRLEVLLDNKNERFYADYSL